MTKRSKGRRKHIPQRTCVGCRQVLSKRMLIRIVRTADGVFVDPSSRQPGRGAYLHDQRDCWQLGLKGSLAKALKVTLTAEDLERLHALMETLPESTPPESEGMAQTD